VTNLAPRDQEATRRALRRYANEFLLLITPRGEVVASSEITTLGYGEAGEGHHVAEYLHPDDLPKVFDIIERARAESGFEDTIRVRVRRADGTWGLFEATVMDAMQNAELRGAVVRVRDVTTEQTVSESPADSQRFLSLAEALPLGILSADARGYVVFSNHEAELIFNLSAEDLMGRGWETGVVDEDKRELLAATQRVVSHFIPQEVTFRLSKAMFTRWAHAKFVPLGQRTSTTGWIATVDDITDRRRSESELAHIATHDPLTQLPNRLLLEDRLRQATARLRRGTSSLTVAFLDLDGFKEVNDTYGHKAGDGVLVEVANRLTTAVRDVDTVARFAGDEFVIVCETVPDADCSEVIARVHAALAPPIAIGASTVQVGASIGCITTTEPDVSIEELLAVADQAMYRQKRSRR
jgi:diguanylate cyclase (GGDEF)-like protein/PAS domain S-box-containing protein